MFEKNMFNVKSLYIEGWLYFESHVKLFQIENKSAFNYVDGSISCK